MSDQDMKTVGDKTVIEIMKQPEFTGSFSKVFYGNFDEKPVVVKRLDRDEKLSLELEFLREFQHENVVKYLYKDVDENFLYIVLEKCDFTLRKFVNSKRHSIPHLSILWQITSGLAYLHNHKNLIHRDLKPCNILMITQDHKWVAKITDFGISKRLSPDKTRLTQTSVKGTVGYSAPETLNEEKIGKRTDIFSLGIIFYYVLSEGRHPFGDNNLRIDGNICDETVEPNVEGMNEKYAQDIETLILSMIARKREERLYIDEVRAHHVFWDAGKKLAFIQEVSDYCISEANFDVMSPIMEEKKADIVGEWRKTIYDISPVVEEVFKKMRHKRQNDGLLDLLRNIRNLKHHYHEKPENFKQEIGTMPDGMLAFFTNLFPKLLSYVYDIMKCRKDEFNFEKFYKFKPSIGVDPGHIPASSTTDVDAMSVLESDDKKNSKNDTGYLSTSEEEKEELVLRKYQWELAAQALEGRNSLIVAPTGSGKTAVLAGIIQKHISDSKSGVRRVLFMVPKTALAEQQFMFLDRYLSCTVGYIIGEFTPLAPTGQKILDCQVTVLTAQILINELKRKSDESCLTFDDISMLIFDECHNATKKHPYKEIMDMFQNFRKEKRNGHHIQIVGATASPGVGKAKDKLKVKENLLELLANLDITSAPSVVLENQEELKKHQNEIAEFYIKVQTEIEFGQEVIKVMSTAEEQVKKINEENDASELNKIPIDKSKQAYEKWTDDLKQYAKLKMRDQESARILITYAEHLNMYNCLLLLKDLVPNAMEYTNKMVTFQHEGFENKELLRKNQELQKNAKNIRVPMLDRLFGILQQEFSQNKNARCIIFVKRKLTARSLEECIIKEEGLSGLNPKYLTGKNDHGGAEAMTEAAHKSILKSFRDGECKVLIATSVAEEGLDIKECNLVVMYNYVTGEVGRIQRRGRGRAWDSRAILITSMGSNHLRLEEDNMLCAKASEQAIEDVKRIPAIELENQIKGVQEKQRAASRRKREMALKADKNESPSKWELLCGKCKNFITTGDKLRHIEDTHVVVKDPDFESRVIKQIKEQKKGPNVVGTADFLCNNPKCGIKIALEMINKTHRYPTLSIKKILLRREGGKICDPKKRSLLPFVVSKSVDESDEEAEIEAVKRLADAIGNVSLHDDENMELLEILQ